jgi:hypothetical protein
MICSYCYDTQIVGEYDVGHWWNNPADSVYVCSKKCYTELEKLVTDGTWMEHKPEAIFGKKKKVKKEKVIESITDKRFTSNL